jgi:hypothetical protein
MKQTAVEWLVEFINSDQYQKAFGQTYISVALVEDALAMEKGQIENAYNDGYDIRDSRGDLSDNLTSEQYYNEQYGK